MKIWKSLLATILVLAALLTFVACDSGSKKKSKDDDDEDDETEESSNVSGVSGDVSGDESGKENSKEESEEGSEEESEDEYIDSLDGTVWVGETDFAEYFIYELFIQMSLDESEMMELAEHFEDFDEPFMITIEMFFDEEDVEIVYSIDEDDGEEFLEAFCRYIYDFSDIEEDFDEWFDEQIESFEGFGAPEKQVVEYSYSDGYVEMFEDEYPVSGKTMLVDGVTFEKQ